MFAAYSPGPYRVQPIAGSERILDGSPRHAVIADMRGRNHAANAKLFAASPRLVDALEQILTDLKDYADLEGVENEEDFEAKEHVRQARLVLAEAKGAQ